jgi:hypothetical protein
MGLRCGRPTWVCPFFGDQFFWGARIHSAGCGVQPCPVQQLSLQVILQSLEALLSDEGIHQRCREVSEVMQTEDGVQGAAQAFYRHLPLQNMICDVSLLQDKRNVQGELELELAQVYCQNCELKMSLRTFRALHSASSLRLQDHTCVPCSYMDYSLQSPHSPAEGLVQGLGGLMHELLGGLTDATADPIHGIYVGGLSGGVAGVVTGLHSLLQRQLVGGNLLVQRVNEGLLPCREYMRLLGEASLGNAALTDAWQELTNKSVMLVDRDSNNSYSALRTANTSAKSRADARLVRYARRTSRVTTDVRTKRISVRSEELCTTIVDLFRAAHGSPQEREEPRADDNLAGCDHDELSAVASQRSGEAASLSTEQYRLFLDEQRELDLLEDMELCWGDLQPPLQTGPADKADGCNVIQGTATARDVDLDCPPFLLSAAPDELRALSLLLPPKEEADRLFNVTLQSPLLGSFYLQHDRVQEQPGEAVSEGRTIEEALSRASTLLALFRRLGAKHRRYAFFSP